MQNVKFHSKEAHLGRIFDLGVRKKDTTLVWGYAEEIFLIRGYASTKKLRTPGIDYFHTSKLIPDQSWCGHQGNVPSSGNFGKTS